MTPNPANTRIVTAPGQWYKITVDPAATADDTDLKVTDAETGAELEVLAGNCVLAISDAFTVNKACFLTPTNAPGGGARVQNTFSPESTAPISGKGVADAFTQYAQGGLMWQTRGGKSVLTDKGVLSLFEQMTANNAAMAATANFVLGIEVPRWPDLANSTTGPTVTVDGVAYGQHAPWAQTIMTEPQTFIRKLADNAGLVADFHEQGITPEDARDDYENVLFFQDIKVNYITDDDGNRYVSAVYGSPNYAETGSVDVGVLSLAYYIKIVETVNTTDYDPAKYAKLFSRFGGVPVRQIFVSLSIPKDENGNEEEGWHICSGAVRSDGTVAPYVIRTPYLSGIGADGKPHSQPGLLAVNGVCYYDANNLANSVWDWYENPASDRYKGGGYHGGTMELWTFVYLNMLLKYGAKSSQTVANGVDERQTVISEAPASETTPGNVVPVSAEVAETVDVGVRVCVRREETAGTFVDWDNTNYINGLRSVQVIAKEERPDGLVNIVLDIPANKYFNPAAVGGLRLYLRQGFPRTGQTDAVKGHRDGCIGRAHSHWSPFRIRMLEVCCGFWELITDFVGVSTNRDGSVQSWVYAAPKGGQGTRKNKTADFISSWIPVGKKIAVASSAVYPSEYEFKLTGGDVNHKEGTGAAYIGDIIYPKFGMTYPTASGMDTAYGDGYYSANTDNTAYELLVGGAVNSAGIAGVLYLTSGSALSTAHWTRSARD